MTADLDAKEASQQDCGSKHPLPVRPRPVEREAVIGYLIRVAAANGYETPRQLWTALQIHTQEDVLDVLCERLNLSADEVSCLFGTYPSYWRIPIQHVGLVSADFNHYLMRWCPLCLWVFRTNVTGHSGAS